MLTREFHRFKNYIFVQISVQVFEHFSNNDEFTDILLFIKLLRAFFHSFIKCLKTLKNKLIINQHCIFKKHLFDVCLERYDVKETLFTRYFFKKHVLLSSLNVS